MLVNSHVLSAVSDLQVHFSSLLNLERSLEEEIYQEQVISAASVPCRTPFSTGGLPHCNAQHNRSAFHTAVHVWSIDAKVGSYALEMNAAALQAPLGSV